jgi:hypothetical protein
MTFRHAAALALVGRLSDAPARVYSNGEWTCPGLMDTPKSARVRA